MARPLALVALIPGGSAWYLPGVAPHDFEMGQRVDIKVNKLTSTKTQIPYDNYALPFCQPTEGVEVAAENLGEFLTGDRIESSPYVVRMRESSQCNILCQKVRRRDWAHVSALFTPYPPPPLPFSPQVLHYDDAEVFKAAITEDYMQNWIIDNLPAASIHQSSAVVHRADDDEISKTESYRKGFPVGYTKVQAVVSRSKKDKLTTVKASNVEFFLYNHVELTLDYHDVGEGLSRVVGFAVEPRSVKHRFANGEHWNGLSGPSNVYQPEGYMPYLATCMSTGMADPLKAAAQEDRFERSEDYADDDDGDGYLEVEPQPVEPGTVVFTYDVRWRQSAVRWASRWDVYLAAGSGGDAAHWLPLVNALGVALALGGIVAIILGRAVKSDLDKYNSNVGGGWFAGASAKPMLAGSGGGGNDHDDLAEETGWKLVYGRVFATPPYALAFAVACGSGAHLFWTFFSTGVLSAVGLLSPANRGSLFVAGLCFFCLYAYEGAYRAGRLFKAFAATSAASGSWGGADLVPPWPRGVPVWAWPGLGVGLGFPGACALTLTGANVALSGVGSTGAVPLTPALQLGFFWLCVCAPLAVVGAFRGFDKDPAVAWPLKVVSAAAARPIPPNTHWATSPAVAAFLGGALPFCAVLAELHFALGGLWSDSYYYVFGFALASLLVLALTCAEVAVVLVYCQLCAEDPRWWWRAFLCSASTAAYVFLYSVFYFSKLEANLAVTYVIYFGYMGLLCASIFLACGSIGVAAALWFVKNIYIAVKSD